MMYIVFFFKQKTAYEMRISDWSSDVCSSDLTLSAGSSEVITTPSVVYLAMSPGDAGMTVIQKRGADRRAPFYLGFAIPLGGIAVFADLAGACAGLLRRFLGRIRRRRRRRCLVAARREGEHAGSDRDCCKFLHGNLLFCRWADRKSVV